MLCGAGFGFFTGPSLAIILAGVQPANAGAASGVLAMVGQVASAFGVALVGALLFSLLERPGAPEGPAQFASAISLTLVVHVLIYALACGLVFLLPKVERGRPPAAPAPAAEPAPVIDG